MTDWDKARMGVNLYYPDPDDANTVHTHRLKLPNRVATKTVFNYRPYGGLTEWNQGVYELPPEFTITIAVPATSNSNRLLRALHVSGVPFNLDIADINASDEFALITETFIECRITVKELPIVVGELPMITYQAMALRYSYVDNQTDGINVDGNGGNTDSQFGSGKSVPSTIDLFAEWS